MQREPRGTTFRDIHGTKEAWFESIENVLDVALVKASDDDQPLQIRLLQPRSLTDFESGTCLDFFVSPLQDVSNLSYITVSYCWAQSDYPYPLEIPEYRIWESDNATTCRPPHCPRSVFYRAIRFARHKGCSLLWVDQECIDQSDPKNIEMHLQIMHRVYQASIYTVAPLSIDPFLQPARTPNWPPKYPGDPLAIEPNFFDQLQTDLWFGRSWTFQERQCASCVMLLIPTKWRKREDRGRQLSDVCKLEDDLCVELREVNAM